MTLLFECCSDAPACSPELTEGMVMKTYRNSLSQIAVHKNRNMLPFVRQEISGHGPAYSAYRQTDKKITMKYKKLYSASDWPKNKLGHPIIIVKWAQPI